MSKTNNRRLRERVRKLELDVWALAACCRCAYCDEIMLSEREELLAHAKVCPKHPCRALEAELAVVKADFGAALDKLNALGVWWCRGTLVDGSGQEVTGVTTAGTEPA